MVMSAMSTKGSMFTLYHKRREQGCMKYLYAKYTHYLSIPPLKRIGLIREARGEGEAKNELRGHSAGAG